MFLQIIGGGGGTPSAPWYERGVFWGFIGLAVAFAALGFGSAMSGYPTLAHLFFWLTWPWAMLAAWIAIKGLTARKRFRIIGAVAAGIVIAVGIGLTDRALTRKNKPQDLSAHSPLSAPVPHTVQSAGPEPQQPAAIQKSPAVPGKKPRHSKPVPKEPLPTPPPQQTINAPNGIAIGGGTVSNPTVNNFGPQPAKVEMSCPDKAQEENEGYTLNCVLYVTAGVVPKLQITAYGWSVTRVMVSVQTVGGMMSGHGVHGYSNVMSMAIDNAYGRYFISIQGTTRDLLAKYTCIGIPCQ